MAEAKAASKTGFRIRSYRKLTQWILGSGVLKLSSGARSRLSLGTVSFGIAPGSVSEIAQSPLLWFHAASVGELESLWTVVIRWLVDGGTAVVTVFSESAIGRVKVLQAEAERIRSGAGANLLFSGYSPWEGRWAETLEGLRPAAFITAKYEAWPELWASLSELDIPLVIVGAKDRSSLRFVKKAIAFLGSALPKLTLLTLREKDQGPLRQVFPMASVQTTGDPRWDRVQERSKQGHPRARELISSLAAFPRPWGVLGSAWIEDLKAFGHRLYQVSGTLWVVPHRVDAETLAELRRQLEQGYGPVIQTSRLKDFLKEGVLQESGTGKRPAIIVDEMGFLSELYSSADWAFVGGGFGLGVHSTIEPAIQGVPVACGPVRAESFAEISDLADSGQLRLVRDSTEIAEWLKVVGVLPHQESIKCVTPEDRARWKEEVSMRIGATDRVLAQIRSLIS